ncbi:MAG: hypothetical protein PHP03_03250 [Candidatus Pacebacteria bacterium]|nr:hypothetical protein [Candidatus Paceibacterota bacterium]
MTPNAERRKLYEIPLMISKTMLMETGARNHDIAMYHIKCHPLNEKELTLFYSDKKHLNPFGSDKQGSRFTRMNFFVRARNGEEAIEKAKKKISDAKSKHRKIRFWAMTIDRDRPILELPDCPQMGKIDGNSFACCINYNELQVNHACVLEGYPMPPNTECPIAKFYDFVEETFPSATEKIGKYIIIKPLTTVFR